MIGMDALALLGRCHAISPAAPEYLEHFNAHEERVMYDVIIVGARCAGSSLGRLLARRGYRILLVDRDPFPSDMPMSAHFVH